MADVLELFEPRNRSAPHEHTRNMTNSVPDEVPPRHDGGRKGLECTLFIDFYSLTDYQRNRHLELIHTVAAHKK